MSQIISELEKLFASFDPTTSQQRELLDEIRDCEDEIKKAADAGQYDRIGLLCYARDIAKSQLERL
jgi:hypothetical protein